MAADQAAHLAFLLCRQQPALSRRRAFPPALQPGPAALLTLRGERPTWGPRKLRAYLSEERPGTARPAASTIGDLLKRHGLPASTAATRIWRHTTAPPLCR